MTPLNIMTNDSLMVTVNDISTPHRQHYKKESIQYEERVGNNIIDSDTENEVKDDGTIVTIEAIKDKTIDQ